MYFILANFLEYQCLVMLRYYYNEYIAILALIREVDAYAPPTC
jgi:hypothetical protein